MGGVIGGLRRKRERR